MYENGIQSALIEVESIRTEEKLWLQENLMYWYVPCGVKQYKKGLV